METTKRARKCLRDGWLALLDIYERDGWHTLGYSTWADYVRVEFCMSRQHSYRLLDAAQVVESVTQGRHGTGPGPQTERQCRELARIAAAEIRREVWEEAERDGDTSAAALRELVDAAIVDEQAEVICQLADDQGEAPGGKPRRSAATSGTDWAARIVRKVAAARALHRKLGPRQRAADQALDGYLAVVRGEG